MKRLTNHILRMLAILAVFVPAMLQAQTIVIEGHIADQKTGHSLPMASVKSSSGTHTISNEYGAFKIKAVATDQLTFSYVGYQPKTIAADKVSRIVKLEPKENVLKDVTAMSTDKRIETIIKTAREQLSDNKNEQSTFFYRQLSLVNDRPSNLTEAFINARSAMLIRNMELITGRYSALPNNEAHQTYASDFLVFSQIGMLLNSRNEPEWEDIVPLSSNYKSFYNVSLEMVGDCYVLRFKPKGNFYRSVVDCTLFVDVESMHLRKAVGSVRQLKITHNAGTPHSYALPIRLQFTCHYNSDRGFCEVQSITTNILYQTDETNYTFQSTLYNVGPGAIKEAQPLGRVYDLRKQIEKVPFVRSFWDEHETVKRTEQESSIDEETPSAARQLSKWIDNMERFNRMFPQEKVYVHLDNSGYFMGETMWMKAYVVRADNNASTNMSRVLYVDLVSPAGEVVTTKKLMITNGEAEGSFELNGLIGSGFYEVRAYTRYMLNWDDLGVFSRVVPIFKEPQKEGDYSHAVIDKTDYRHRLPDYRGSSDVQQAKEKMNVRFYPEGGQLIKQRESKVAFEILDQQGRGIKTTGELKVGDHVIGPIQSGSNGRGLFSVTPSDEPAKVVLTMKDGREQAFELPEALASGATLAVDALKDDRITVSVATSADLNGMQLGLALMNNGNINAFTVVTAVNDDFKTTFRRTDLDEGVNRLLLFDQEGNILSDRLFFIYPTESVDSITFTAVTKELRPSQKATIVAQTRPNSRFSVAIHDHDTEVNGRLQRADSWLLLSSELRGYIENADYYLESDDAEHRSATDLLMMVQGWHRYNARQMMTQRRLEKKQPIEDQLFLFGQLRNKKRTDAPAFDNVKLQATLFNQAGDVLRGDARTDSLGHFLFGIPDCVGPWRMQLRTTKNERPENYYISIDRQPDVTPRQLEYGEQQPLHSVYQPLEILKASDNFDEELPMELRNHLLGEVFVKGKKRYQVSEWDDETIGARKASLRYDCQRVVEEYGDKGLTPPNLFQWLKDRNEFFGGDGKNIFEDAYGWYAAETKLEEEHLMYMSYSTAAQQSSHRDEVLEVYNMRTDMPRCDDDQCSNIQDVSIGDHYTGALVNDPGFRPQILPQAGLSYKRQPIVWVLNNVFYAVTQTPTFFKPIDIDWLAQFSPERMPEDLEDVKSVYISEDELIWKRYIRSTRLESLHPVTVFVYSDGTFSEKEKGVRNTYFDGFSVDSYEMPGYTELPPIGDFRRTLYWNPDVETDSEGKATIEFFNSPTCRRINISAEGIADNGHVVIYNPPRGNSAQ